MGVILQDLSIWIGRWIQKNGIPHKHPLNHYDVHLSNQVTFKIGCHTGVTPDWFIEFLDNDSDRWYVVPTEIAIRKNLIQ